MKTTDLTLDGTDTDYLSLLEYILKLKKASRVLGVPVYLSIGVKKDTIEFRVDDKLKAKIINLDVTT